MSRWIIVAVVCLIAAVYSNIVLLQLDEGAKQRDGIILECQQSLNDKTALSDSYRRDLMASYNESQQLRDEYNRLKDEHLGYMRDSWRIEEWCASTIDRCNIQLRECRNISKTALAQPIRRAVSSAIGDSMPYNRSQTEINRL